MSSSEYSHAKLVPAVREILEGEDLSKMTLKIVRERLLRTLGNPSISDVGAFKGYVKSALAEVLATSSNQAKETIPPTSSPKTEPGPVTDKPKTVSKTESAQNDEGVEDQQRTPTKKKQEASVGEADTPVTDVVATNKTAVEKDVSAADTSLPMKRARPASPKSDSKKDDVEHDGSDNALSSDVMSSDDERGSKQVKRKRRQRVDKNSKSAKHSSSTDDKRLEKLNGALRALGLRMPTRQLQRKSSAQKCDAILQFLQTKNIDTDPTLLSKRELTKHRKRLETEKELLGIDTRPKRRAAAPVAFHPAISDFPSDLSGPELSEEDKKEDAEEEEEVDEYALSSDSE